MFFCTLATLLHTLWSKVCSICMMVMLLIFDPHYHTALDRVLIDNRLLCNCSVQARRETESNNTDSINNDNQRKQMRQGKIRISRLRDLHQTAGTCLLDSSRTFNLSTCCQRLYNFRPTDGLKKDKM